MMRNSGFIWLEHIPSEWQLTRIGSLFSLRNERVSDKDYPPLSVTMKGVVPQLEGAAKTEDGDNRKLVKTGDFVINSRSDRRGSCGISAYEGSVSLINTVLTPRNEINSGFYNWLFHTVAFADEFYKWGHGIVDDLWTTRWQEMKRIVVPVPPLEEQAKITNYLNEQIFLIDSIIEMAARNIEEYTKWRSQTILEAVTKGLNKSVAMRESHVEWMGLIPYDWKTIRFNKANWIRARLGWKGLKADEYVLEGYPFLSAYNIVNNQLSWDNLNYINQERYDESPEIKLSLRDIVLVKDGAGIGKVARVDELPYGESTVNSSLAVITPAEIVDYRYEYYYLQSPLFSNIINRLKNGMGVPHLTQEAMKEIRMPLPPKSIQVEIADYLDVIIKEINEAIFKKNALIEDLELYKRSLIYETVTGKRKVV